MPHVPEYYITFLREMQEKNSLKANFYEKRTAVAVLDFLNGRMPQDAAVPCFFTRYVKQAGALQLTFRRPLACLAARGHDVHV